MGLINQVFRIHACIHRSVNHRFCLVFRFGGVWFYDDDVISYMLRILLVLVCVCVCGWGGEGEGGGGGAQSALVYRREQNLPSK